MIQLSTWEDTIGVDGKPTGSQHYVGSRKIADIYHELVAGLEAEQLWKKLDYFTVSSHHDHGNTAFWPDHKWIACYVVTGGSEGHYIHVSTVAYAEGDPEHHWRERLIFIGKTFEGREVGYEIAQACARLLGA